MGFSVESVIIDGMDFKVTVFPATEAFKLKRKLAKLFIPFITSVLGGSDKVEDILDKKVDSNSLSSAFTSILDELSEDEFLNLMRRMLASTTCIYKDDKGEPVQIDFSNKFEEKLNLVFTGKTFSIYPLLFFVLKVNYPDFFAKVGDIGKNIKTLMSQK